MGRNLSLRATGTENKWGLEKELGWEIKEDQGIQNTFQMDLEPP